MHICEYLVGKTFYKNYKITECFLPKETVYVTTPVSAFNMHITELIKEFLLNDETALLAELREHYPEYFI